MEGIHIFDEDLCTRWVAACYPISTYFWPSLESALLSTREVARGFDFVVPGGGTVTHRLHLCLGGFVVRACVNNVVPTNHVIIYSFASG